MTTLHRWICFALVLGVCCSTPLGLLAQTYSLVLGIDGLSPYGIEAGAAPNIRALMDGSWAGTGSGYRGSFSSHAFSGGVPGTAQQQATLSGPAWSSIHTGVWTDLHGVTNNSFSGSQFAARPSYLKLLESQVAGIRTEGIVTWSPINSFIFAPDGVNPDLDFRQGTGNDATTVSVAVSRISGLSGTAPAAVFLHLDDIDIAGHSSGMYSANYLGQVADVDSQIGSILSAVRNRAGFAGENWQVLLVSDHGHVGSGGHGGQSMMERTIPVIASSRTVLQGLAPTDVRQPSLVDIPATVLNHFGVSTPSGQQGQPLGLSTLDLSSRPSLANGLLSHLTFDGNTAGSPGTSGGTAVGNVQFEAGRFGQAARVATYGSGRVRLDQDLGAVFGSNTDFAFSMWMKYDSASGDPAVFSNKNWNSGNNVGINLALQTAGGGSLDLNTFAAGGSRRDIEPLGGVEAGSWQHILFNVDRDGRTLLYVNGSLFGEIPLSSAGSFDGAFQWTFFNDGTGLYSGGSVSGLMFDEFGAWNRLLTRDEISFLSRAPIGAVPEPGPGLIACLAIGLAGWYRRRPHGTPACGAAKPALAIPVPPEPRLIHGDRPDCDTPFR